MAVCLISILIQQQFVEIVVTGVVAAPISIIAILVRNNTFGDQPVDTIVLVVKVLAVRKKGCSEGCTQSYYQFYNYRRNGFVCIRCQENCVTCNNATQCLTCEPGYWGSYCQYSCSGCASYSNCSKASGCIGDCVSGYYGRQMGSEYHCAECPDDNCLICLNATHCQDCIFGYYLKSGQYCDECPSRCSSCTTYDYCTSCRRPWYWGAKCEYDCVGCYRNCSRLHGCSAGCGTSYYKTPKPSYEDGFECRPCPEYCTTYMNASKCIACKEGYWGTSCQHN